MITTEECKIEERTRGRESERERNQSKRKERNM